MAIKLVKTENGVYTEDFRRLQIQEFIVDSDEDFKNLPPCDTGSTALSVSGNMMIVDASGNWVPFGG